MGADSDNLLREGVEEPHGHPIREKQPRIYNLVMIAKLAFIHIVALYAVVNLRHMKPWTITYTFLLTLCAMLGITAGAHRLWAHRSYSATWPLRLFLSICYTLSCQLSIYTWVRTHRLHHKYTDTEADPHNSKRGFFFSHVGWLLVNKNQECQEKIKEIDMSDILMDPISRLQSRFFIAFAHALMVLPTFLPVLLWGEDIALSFASTAGVRVVVSLQFSMSVNSFAHMFGSKPYNKRILPTDGAMVSFFTLGEGWHNYHHTFPWDSKTSEFGDRLNLTSRFLDLCAKLGLAYNLKTASPEMISNMKEKYGDGSHAHDREILC